MNNKKYDVTIIGGGHNGLVAATYLAKAGKSVVILEANSEVGGATQVFNHLRALMQIYQGTHI